MQRSTFYLQNYQNAQRWFQNNFGSELRNQRIRFFLINNPNATRDDVISVFCNIDCLCELEYPEQDIRQIKKMYLEQRGDFYRCGEIVFVYQYFLLHKNIPNEEQLTEMVRNTIDFERNPEAYHQKDKVFVPTLHLDKLSPIVKDTIVDEICSLCQNEIGYSAFYKLPPCNHIFHATKEACLGNAGIIDWLGSHTQCPNCKTKVVIE